MPDSVVTYVSPVTYICLSSFYISFYASKKNVNPFVKSLVKILPHLNMVFTINYMFATAEEPYPTIVSAYYLLKLSSTLYMYAYIMIADVLLNFKTTFVYGLMYTCVAQYNMSYMISEDYAMFVRLSVTEKLSLGVFCLLTLSIYIYVLPRLSLMQIVPGFIYSVLFTTSIWSASLHLQRLVSLCTVGTNLGTILLLVVTAMFARSKWRSPSSSSLFKDEWRIMIVYYAALFLIVYCTIQAENEPTFRVLKASEKIENSAISYI